MTAAKKPLGMARAATIRHELARQLGTGEAVVRPHPAGGHTVAFYVPGTATARVYIGQHATKEAALEAAAVFGRQATRDRQLA